MEIIDKQKMKKIYQNGQALIEYVLVIMLALMIAVGVFKVSMIKLAQQQGSLNYILSKKLSSGFCPENCFMYESFNNH
jgi:hypothetical protein